MGTDEGDAVEHEAWTADALAEVAGISGAYIRRLCRQGRLKARKFGWAWLIPYEEGQRWLEERAAAQAEPSSAESDINS
jgi:excisionase family DNA binding protein